MSSPEPLPRPVASAPLPPRRREGWPPWPLSAALCLALLAVSLTAAVDCNDFRVADDAHISFRYAENLAAGHGFSFNREGPPTEGYSNFALVVLLALGSRLGLDVIQLSLAIGIGSLALTVLALLWLTRGLTAPAGLWAPVTLAVSTLAARSAVNGLETSLYALLLLAGVALLVVGLETAPPGFRQLAVSGVLLALAAMTRPEAPLFVIALSLSRLGPALAHWRARRRLQLWGELSWVVAFLAVFVPYSTWRLNSFGHLLPNAYYAKEFRLVAGPPSKLEAGFDQLLLGVLSEPIFALAVLGGAVAWLRSPTLRVRTLLAVVTAQSLFLVLSGGDWPHMFSENRFLFAVYPICLWLVAEAVLRRATFRSATIVGLLCAVLIVLSQLHLPFRWLPDLPAHYVVQPVSCSAFRSLAGTWLRQPLDLAARRHEILGLFSSRRLNDTFDTRAALWLKRRYGSETRVATIQMGRFAFWSGFPMFDLFGIVTPELARAKDPTSVAEAERLLERFDPRLICFYRSESGVHHAHWIRQGLLQRLGFGFRLWLYVSGDFSFVVFEKGHPSRLDPELLLLLPTEESMKLVPPDDRVLLEPGRG